jgi:anti-anti-sigma regulatory factor
MSEGSAEASFSLPEKLTIVNADQVHKTLEEWFKNGQEAELDGCAVTQVDTAGLQILISLKNTLSAEGTTLTWGELSEPLKAAIGLAGLAKDLEI